MKHYLFKKRFVPCVVMAGALVLAGCTDNDYDFNGIDMTVGLGGDGLTLPVSSTDTIKLADVLELDGTECVVIKPNGDYVFEQKGDDVEPAHPAIAVITVSQNTMESKGIPVTVTPVAAQIGEFNITAGGEVLNFTYSGEKPDDVVSLDHVGVDARLELDVDFPDALKISGVYIDELTVELPHFMEFDDIRTDNSYTVSGSKFVFTNVLTSEGVHLDAAMSGLDFNAVDTSLGSIRIEGGNVVLDGHIRANIDATVSNPAITEDASGEITASLRLDDIRITSATGKFDPSIDLDNLGSVNVTGVPDFLTDGNVVVDLYNPQIILSLDNDMDVGGFINGTITSVKDGVEAPPVVIDDIPVKAGGTTSVCICRRDENLAGGPYDVVKVVDNLSDLIRTIPDRIDFSADVRADASQTASFEFGRRYTVKPGYSVEAPITFDEDAMIVYTDTIDDWNDDIKDLELADGSYVELTTTVENRVPAYLGVHADPIDVDGNVMGEDEISVEVSTTVLASADGEKSAETPLTITVRQGRQGALARLDGLAFRIEGGASDDGQNPVVGKTLNSQKHFLIARDIVVRLVGKVIGDFN